MNRVVYPGGRIGILGSGQLGRMLAAAARRMGYGVHVFSPEAGTPAGQLADVEIAAPYDDLAAVRAFAGSVDVVTYEFENVPAATAAAAAECAPLRPGAAVLHVAQNRRREKETCARLGLPTASFAPVSTPEELDAALRAVGCPAVLKTASSGYDGKGQRRIDRPEAAEAAWAAIGRRPAVLEAFVEFIGEVSMVAARNPAGQFAHFGLIENRHARHILDVSLAPSPLAAGLVGEAEAMARALFETLDVVGVLCIEFFVTDDGRLLVNEIAPRPHNSGHLTIEACVTSQFEQQLRAVCGLPLGDPRFVCPAAMANLLGDLWAGGGPRWAALADFPDVKLHLYGKREARPGRKMGHLTAWGDTVTEAAARVTAAREAIKN
ncbi:5-(carboxyamino)imidazole ribonucleotide synthase [Promineifilum sp.]|uniref:5-(carboxyamino)imidazole ribonucleotide synthase n=1 Tax=Promineifilum sp. TaxID=2664178 RepID=UPI0035B14A46